MLSFLFLARHLEKREPWHETDDVFEFAKIKGGKQLLNMKKKSLVSEAQLCSWSRVKVSLLL